MNLEGSAALDQRSRADKAELRRAEAVWAEELETAQHALQPLERRLAAAERLQRWLSRRAMRAIHDTYSVPNARGEHRLLRAVYAERGLHPPSGAGDCAAPKLLAAAYARGLTPMALAEFWWGPPPPGGGRVSGELYAACNEKCGPLLPFMLQGLEVAAPRRFTPEKREADGLTIVFEDEHLVVVDKPCGLLSVPGRGESLHDSVLSRLKARYPNATGPLLVHRLDLDTSGLLMAALNAETHRALQRMFLKAQIRKRYVAVVEGLISGDGGTIEAPLRGDFHDRPRQVIDPAGKRAVTDWQVLQRLDGRTRVALFPRTGRTHQLRVHASHPSGLGAPIVGDRLYGRAAQRLLLHAEQLEFEHPVTGQRVTVRQPAPF